jgi:tetratricopeptide (TPR) repeat protein
LDKKGKGMAVREGEMEYVTEWKNRGNLLYQEGKYQSAREIYTNCIDTLTNNDIKEVKMLSQLLSNRAQTFFQERNFANALNDINKALHLDMLNEKAMLRKLVALESLERFEKALEEVDALLNKTSLLSTPMVDQLLLIRRRLRKNIQQDKKVAATESKGIEKLVHKHQQLRINFG